MSRPAWINVGGQDLEGNATVTAATDTLTITGHGLSNGDIVMVENLTGGADGPLIEGAVYFVRNVAGDDFQLSGTRGSQLKTFDTDGTADVLVAVPRYNAQVLRLNDTVTLFHGSADRLGARQGVRPGGPAVISVAGTDWTVHDHSGVVYPGISSISGPYRYHQLEETDALDPADGSSDRVDALDLLIEDDDEDATGFRRSRAVYVTGTPGGGAPAVTPNALRLGTILVPAGGSPSPTVNSLGQFTVASGGVLPVRDGGSFPSSGTYEGMYADRDEALWRRTGSDWLPATSPNSPTLVEYSGGSGTFDKADFPWAKKVKVKVQGGGGGGGGSAATGGGEAAPGAGGSGGGYAESIIDIADLEASVTVTIGGGGSGGSPGNNNGDTGGDSSFGAHVVGEGGGGGQGGANTGGLNVTDAGNGGGASINTGTGFIRPGDPGHNSSCDQGVVGNLGHGGGSMMGAGARCSGTNVGGAGSIGGAHGGGGSGAFTTPNQSAFAGGSGFAGNIVVEVY